MGFVWEIVFPNRATCQIEFKSTSRETVKVYCIGTHDDFLLVMPSFTGLGIVRLICLKVGHTGRKFSPSMEPK